MVRVIGLKQLPGQDVSHGLWNALQYHKTTYYLCGLAMGLFLVGFFAVTCTCLGACESSEVCLNRRRSGRRPPRGLSYYDYYFYRGASGSNDCCCCCCCEDTTPRGGRGGGECDLCVNCTPCACECPKADCNHNDGPVVVLAVIFFIFVLIGMLVAIFMVSLVLQKAVQRHFKLLEKTSLAEDYQVVDLSSSDDPEASHDSDLESARSPLHPQATMNRDCAASEPPAPPTPYLSLEETDEPHFAKKPPSFNLSRSLSNELQELNAPSNW